MEARAASAALPAPAPRLRRRSLTDEVGERIAAEYILSEAVSPGALLPSEKELSARYGVSRVTLRAGLRSLQDAGLIAVRHGVGSVVLARSRALTHGLDSLASLESMANVAGQKIGTDQLHWSHDRADRKLATRLGGNEGDLVVCVRRAKTLGGQRVAWLEDYVPAGLLALEVMRREFAGSILDVLLAHDEIAVEYEDTNLQPVKLSRELARRLGVAAGTAAMHMEGTTWTADGVVAEVSDAWLLPEHFTFSIRRRRGVRR